MARHRDYYYRRLDTHLSGMVYNPMLLLWTVVLLRVLPMPQVLRQLLWLLRSAEREAQVPG